MLDSGLVSVNIIGYKACEIAYTQCEEWLTQAIGYRAKRKACGRLYEGKYSADKGPPLGGHLSSVVGLPGAF